MDINVDVRKKQLDSISHFINAYSTKIENFIDDLNWDIDIVLKTSKLVNCPLNTTHQVREDKLKNHLNQCSSKCDQSLEEKIDKSQNECVEKGLEENPSTNTSLSTYENINTLIGSAQTELQNNDTKTRDKTYLELLAEERDAKRRRAKYRAKNVSTKRKNYLQVLREVISNQMEFIFGQNDDHVKQQHKKELKSNDKEDEVINNTIKVKEYVNKERRNEDSSSSEKRYKYEKYDRNEDYKASKRKREYEKKTYKREKYREISVDSFEKQEKKDKIKYSEKDEDGWRNNKIKDDSYDNESGKYRSEDNWDKNKRYRKYEDEKWGNIERKDKYKDDVHKNNKKERYSKSSEYWDKNKKGRKYEDDEECEYWEKNKNKRKYEDEDYYEKEKYFRNKQDYREKYRKTNKYQYNENLEDGWRENETKYKKYKTDVEFDRVSQKYDSDKDYKRYYDKKDSKYNSEYKK